MWMIRINCLMNTCIDLCVYMCICIYLYVNTCKYNTSVGSPCRILEHNCVAHNCQWLSVVCAQFKGSSPHTSNSLYVLVDLVILERKTSVVSPLCSPRDPLTHRVIARHQVGSVFLRFGGIPAFAKYMPSVLHMALFLLHLAGYTTINAQSSLWLAGSIASTPAVHILWPG